MLEEPRTQVPTEVATELSPPPHTKRPATDILESELNKIKKKHDERYTEDSAKWEERYTEDCMVMIAAKEIFDCICGDNIRLKNHNTTLQQEKAQLQGDMKSRDAVIMYRNQELASTRSDLGLANQKCERQDREMKEIWGKIGTLEDAIYKQTLAATETEGKQKEKDDAALSVSLRNAEQDLEVMESRLKGKSERISTLELLEAFVGKFMAEGSKFMVRPKEKAAPSIPALQTEILEKELRQSPDLKSKLSAYDKMK
ncbi:uncharacterized protein N0V89_004249 [Didymosphaeria variabile]|uniref:Uncharacterized protein n=1 Tax=Didymosphaeria variabile TaxID=1932322 RepID=A0A9W8XPW9_9PLEO|nr:uncharacterized protein N0V89_004249 [Didymosphaeria variabile]KAJ4356219.1 hypothetical protein N0V89_004249 [Didymosphaeria variabile]